MQRVIEAETGKKFERRDSPFGSRCPYDVLVAPDTRWKRVVAARFRPLKNLTMTQSLRFCLALQNAILKSSPGETIDMIPLSSRNAEVTARSMLWAIAFLTSEQRRREVFPGVPAWLNYGRTDTVCYRITSRGGIEPFERLLADDARSMWEFVRAVWNRSSDELPLWHVGLPSTNEGNTWEEVLRKARRRVGSFEIQTSKQ